MNHTSHSISTVKIPAIQNIANAADSLVIEYKEAGFIPDIPSARATNSSGDSSRSESFSNKHLTRQHAQLYQGSGLTL